MPFRSLFLPTGIYLLLALSFSAPIYTRHVLKPETTKGNH